MDKTHPPESFGIFKPVGWIVITLRTKADLKSMHAALRADGFGLEELVEYSPQEMLAQIDNELPNAGVLAEFGQELKIVKAHRVLAENGCNFLVVRAVDDAWAQRVSEQIKRLGAPTAQRYGHLIIEELTERSASEVQFVNDSRDVVETPDDAVLPPHRGGRLDHS
jgi:hypothetical protein